MLSRLVRRCQFVAIPVAVALTVLSCGDPSSVGQSGSPAPASSTQTNRTTPAVDGRSFEAFRRAVQSSPILGSIDSAQATPAVLVATSQVVVVGELAAVDDGGTVTLRQSTVQCESAEGKPVAGTCGQEYSYATALVTVEVAEAYVLPGRETTVQAGGSVKVRIVVGDVFTQATAQASQAAVRAIAQTAPIGTTIVAALTTDDRGEMRLAHPDAWAVVTDGKLLGIATVADRDDTGLAGAHTVEELLGQMNLPGK